MKGVFLFFILYVLIIPLGLTDAQERESPNTLGEASEGHARSNLSVQPVLINDNIHHYPVGLHLEILEDVEGQWTIEDLIKMNVAATHPWIPNLQEVPNFSYSDSVYWLRFQLNSELKTPKQLYLEIAYPHQDYLDFYYVSGQQIKTMIKTGDRRPFHSRVHPYRNFLFDLDLQPHESDWVYLRAQSEDGLHEPLPLILWNQETFTFESGFQQVWLGIYFGILMVMALYNFFVFVSIQDRSYLYYVFYIAVFAFWSFSFEGYAFQIFWPESPEWDSRALLFLSVLIAIMASIFSQSFLKTHRYAPKIDQALTLFILAQIVTLFFSAVGTYAMSILLITVMTIPMILLFIAAGILCWKRGHHSALYYLLAWTTLLMGGLLMLLKVVGAIPSSFLTENGIKIGLVLEVILLSFGLADRINQERKEKYSAQQAALEAEQAKLEAEHQALENLKISDKLKDEFIANISHELRTPLNGIQGFAELLAMGVVQDEIQKQEYYQNIFGESQRLTRIVNNVINVSQLEKGDKPMVIQPVDLLKLKKDLSYDWEDDFGRLILDFPETLAGFESDANFLKMILTELIHNGRVFNKNTPQITVSCRSEKEQVLFEVHDNGIGIAKGYHEKIFEKFFRVDSDIKYEVKGGVGLGLAVVQMAVSALGGTVEVESDRTVLELSLGQREQGSIFKIKFPITFR